MTDPSPPPAAKPGKIDRIIQAITGKAGQITALCLALVTLTEAGRRLIELIRPPVVIPPAVACFQSQPRPPEVVRFSQWDFMELALIGQNDCPEKLEVYFAFDDNIGEDRIRIEPRFKDRAVCLPAEEGCWEGNMLASRQPFKWKVSPPKLILLTDRLDQPVMIYIRSFVYDKVAKTRIDIDTLRLRLEDDRPALTNPAPTTAL